MNNDVRLDGVLWVTIYNRKQLYEFKKVFARSANLSNVDAKRWKLTMRKINSFKNVMLLKLYFDNELIDTWAVVKLNMIHVSLKNLQTLNERSEKEFFKEDWFYGIKDRESLLSMLGSVDNGYFNFIPYPTVITKAAYFWYTIATKQMFHNGNKRTALLTAMFYLQMNGLEFKVKDKESLYNISLSLAKKEMTEKQLVDYISKNVLIDFNWMSYVWERITKEK